MGSPESPGNVTLAWMKGTLCVAMGSDLIRAVSLIRVKDFPTAEELGCRSGFGHWTAAAVLLDGVGRQLD